MKKQKLICYSIIAASIQALSAAPARQWGPEQAIGAPDTKTAEDLPTAWASMSPDAGPEWLQVEFANPVDIEEVRIRESFNPGAIVKVEAISADDRRTVIWEGTPQVTSAPSDKLVKPGSAVVSNKIKIHLDTKRVPGWNEIDAVELLGKDGSRQWAQAATASSTFADASQQQVAPNVQQFNLQELIGSSLMDAQGNPVNPTTLKGKFIGIYFSANWCPPCRQFTPKLIEFRNTHADQFEVVFVSSDRNADDQQKYMQETGMPWPAIPYTSEQVQLLKERFAISGIPSLVVVDGNGTLISTQGSSDIDSDPSNALIKWQYVSEVNKAISAGRGNAPSQRQVVVCKPPEDMTIDPGKSIFGCPIGSSKDDVILKLGKPLGEIESGNGRSSLIYGKDCIITFSNNKLSGIRISRNFLEYSFSIGDFASGKNAKWILSNGITQEMNLSEVQKILGDKFIENARDEFAPIVYHENGSQITLNIQRKENPKSLADYSVYGLSIDNSAQKNLDFIIDPAKSIFGCELGSSSEKVISILGKPSGKYDLGDGTTVLFYEKHAPSCAIFFSNDSLVGIDVGFYDQRNDIQACRLKNGLRLGMTVDQTKAILGEKAAQSPDNQLSYTDGQSKVSFRVYDKKLSSLSIRPIRLEGYNDTEIKLSIDIGKSIFGCKMGASPEQVIELLGQPTSKLDLQKGKSALIYVESFALIFEEGKLCGLLSSQNIRYALAQSFGKAKSSGFFINDQIIENFTKWSFTNGVKPGMSLAEAEKRIGKKFKLKKTEESLNFQTASFEDRPSDSKVTLLLSDKNTLCDYLRIEPITAPLAQIVEDHSKPAREAGIQATLKDNVIVPGKSIFGLPIGATEDEVIQKLGAPDAKREYGKGMFSLIYGFKDVLEFWDGKLGGVSLPSCDLSLERDLAGKKADPYIIGNWKLENGICPGMKISEVEKLLGNKLHRGLSMGFYFEEGGSLVRLIEMHPGEQPHIVTGSGEVAGIAIEPITKPAAIIDPDKSIFGCELGSTPEQVISHFGKPLGELDLGSKCKGMTALVYGEDCKFLFWNGHLGGVELDGVIDLLEYQDRYKNYAIESPSSIGVPSRNSYGNKPEEYDVWRLKDGLRSGMTLDQAKAILGDKFPEKVDHELSYKQGPSRVTFLVFDKMLVSLSIKPENPHFLTDLTIDPAKSIFGLPLGSTQDEVIARLGQPACKLDLRKGATALIYGRDLVLSFWDGLLGGAVVKEGLFYDPDFALGTDSKNVIQRNAWSFTNGMRYGMTVAEFKKLAGTNLLHDDSYGTYVSGPSKVTIISCSAANDNDESDESKFLHGISIEPLKASLNQ